MIPGGRLNVASEIARQQRLAKEIAQLQTDISTQIRVHVASDDPVAAARIARIGIAQADGDTYVANVDRASAIADQVDSSLAGVQTALVRAKELMVQAANGTLSATDRLAIATELKGIAADIATASKATDSSGTALFTRVAAPNAIPIGRGTAVAAAGDYEAIFEGVPLGGGATGTIAGVLATAVAAVEANDTAAISGALAGVDAGLVHIGAAQEDGGVRSSRIKAVAERLAAAKIDLADERNGLESIDTTQAIATLQQKMTTLSAAQAILAQLGRISLFDRIS